MVIFSGKVTAKALPRYRAGFASGKLERIAAGAAMYEALAVKTPNKVAPPRLNPISFPTKIPMHP